MPRKTRITFVRHGEVCNPDRVLYGRLPRFALSRRGREQAAALAAALAPVPVRAVVSSPLLRARQTADFLLAGRRGLSLATSTLLNEVLTPYQGGSETALASRGGDFYTGSPSGFEQPADVLDRMRRFVVCMVHRYPGGHVLAVTHGDPIAFLVLWAAGQPLTPAHKTRLAPLGIPGGYPAPASATTFEVAGNPRQPPRWLAYQTP